MSKSLTGKPQSYHQAEVKNAVLEQDYYYDCTYVAGSLSPSLVLRSALFHSVVYGLTYGFSQGFIFVMYGVVFRFGAFLIEQPVGTILHVEFNNVFRVFFALVFGALAVGQAGSFAPDYNKAKLSANRIFELLDRKPIIDGESEEGSKLVSGSKNSLSCSQYQT